VELQRHDASDGLQHAYGCQVHVPVCKWCCLMLEPSNEETEEESDDESEQGGVVDDELSADPSRMVARGPLEDGTIEDLNSPGES